MKNDQFRRADIRGGTGPQSAADIGAVVGIGAVYESNQVPRRLSDGSFALAANQNSGDTEISVDGAGANGVRRGERVTIAGQTTNVLHGIDADAGKITLTAGLSANRNNDVAVSSANTLDSVIFQPNHLIGAFRTTLPMGFVGGNSPVTPWVDQETGAAMMVEIQRTTSRWTIRYRSLWEFEYMHNGASALRFTGV